MKKHTFKMGVLYDQNAKDEEQGDEAGGMWGAAGYVGASGPSLSGAGFRLGHSDRQPMVGHDPKEYDVG